MYSDECKNNSANLYFPPGSFCYVHVSFTEHIKARAVPPKFGLSFSPVHTRIKDKVVLQLYVKSMTLAAAGCRGL
jgi:hypothetical protein